MIRPQPKKFSPEELKKFEEAASAQTASTRAPLTTDESTYPMFEIPVCDKKLVYVPDFVHTEIDDETGSEITVLNWDKGAFHTVRNRGSFGVFRCNSGITGIEGFDGTCPLCNTMQENWQLYNELYDEVGRQAGVDITTEAGKNATEKERKKLLSEMAVSNKELKVTFPVWDIELVNGKLEPAVDEQGNIKATLCWYTIKLDTFNSKWKPAFQTLSPKKQHAGGKFWLLDYTYECKNGKPTKMQSANALKVYHMSMDDEYKAVASAFDEAAKDWTPELAREVIFANNVFDNPQLDEVAAELMKPVRDKLAVISSRTAVAGAIGATGAPAITGGATAESIAKNFQATPSDNGVAEE